MNSIDDLTVQASHIKNALDGLLDNLYNLNSEKDLRKINIAIATLESVKCLADKHANDLEELSK